MQNRPSLYDAYLRLKVQLSARNSRQERVLTTLGSRLISLMAPKKLAAWTFGMLGVIPALCIGHYLGYRSANKVDFTRDIVRFKSEDHLHSLVDAGNSVLVFYFLPGETISEVTHPEFHVAAHEHSQ